MMMLLPSILGLLVVLLLSHKDSDGDNINDTNDLSDYSFCTLPDDTGSFDVMDSEEREEDDHTKLLVIKIRDCYDNPAFSDIKLKSKNFPVVLKKMGARRRSGS